MNEPSSSINQIISAPLSNHRAFFDDLKKVKEVECFKPQADLSAFIIHIDIVGLTFYRRPTMYLLSQLFSTIVAVQQLSDIFMSDFQVNK